MPEIGKDDNRISEAYGVIEYHRKAACAILAYWYELCTASNYRSVFSLNEDELDKALRRVRHAQIMRDIALYAYRPYAIDTKPLIWLWEN